MSGPTSDTTSSSTTDVSLDSSIVRVLLDTSPDHIYFKDLHSRFVRNNAAHVRSLGAASAAACVGKTDFDFFSREHAAEALRDEQEILRTGEPIIGKVEHNILLDGKDAWVSTTKMVWRDAAGQVIGTFGVTRDITATKLAEDKLNEERTLLRTIIDHLPSRIYVKDAAGRYVLNNRAHLKALGATEQSQVTGRTPLDFFNNERARQAVVDDQRVLSGGPPILGEEKSEFGAADLNRWALTTKVALHDLHGNISGLAGISHDITERKRTEQELQRRTSEMEVDVQMARQIQESFFPHLYPVFPSGVPAEASELRFAHRYIPAATLGGDFFDIIQLSDTECGFLICDVMGHGVRAGLLTALIRGVVEEFARRASSPSLVLAEINHCLMPIIHQTGQPVFATAFYGVIDTAAATLTYANGGHPPPLIVHGATAHIDSLRLESPEPAAGLLEGFVYSNQAIPFNAGDTLLAYTDGFFEASNVSGAMFGQTRLSNFLRDNSTLAGRELIDRLVAEIITFTGQSDFEDDLCAVAIESTGQSCALRPAFIYEI